MEQSTILKSVIFTLLGFTCIYHTAFANCSEEYVKKTRYFLFTKNNPVKAKEHLEACANQGDPGSQVMLAIVYLHGDAKTNPIYDEQKAESLAEAAALQGNAAAQYKYAQILDNALTGDRAYYTLRSLDWAYKAALQGHPRALFQIGDTFEERSLDMVSAYMWYLLSSRRSNPKLSYHEFIVGALKRVKPKLQAQELETAVRLADHWEKQHPYAAKSWPTDDYIENLNGPSKKLIPAPRPGPVTERFCDKFGEAIVTCPQWKLENSKNSEKVTELRKKFYGIE